MQSNLDEKLVPGTPSSSSLGFGGFTNHCFYTGRSSSIDEMKETISSGSALIEIFASVCKFAKEVRKYSCLGGENKMQSRERLSLQQTFSVKTGFGVHDDFGNFSCDVLLGDPFLI